MNGAAPRGRRPVTQLRWSPGGDGKLGTGSQLRDQDCAPPWGSCGKPPSALYVENGGAVPRQIDSRALERRITNSVGSS